LNFDAFIFLLFMTFVSFSVGLLVWAAILRVVGRDSSNIKLLTYVLVPLCVLGFNMVVIISGRWRYLVGAIPIFMLAALALYYRFGNSGASYNAPAPSDFKRRESSKSRRIHESREKRKNKRQKQ